MDVVSRGRRKEGRGGGTAGTDECIELRPMAVTAKTIADIHESSDSPRDPALYYNTFSRYVYHKVKTRLRLASLSFSFDFQIFSAISGDKGNGAQKHLADINACEI